MLMCVLGLFSVSTSYIDKNGIWDCRSQNHKSFQFKVVKLLFRYEIFKFLLL